MRNPIYGFIAFLLTEGLIAAGFATKDNSLEIQEQIETIVFYGSLMITALLGFSKYIEAHKHQVTKDAQVKMDEPVVTTTVTQTVPVSPAIPDLTVAPDPGTPPPIELSRK
jgi:hypothetical protein